MEEEDREEVRLIPYTDKTKILRRPLLLLDVEKYDLDPAKLKRHQNHPNHLCPAHQNKGLRR